MDFFIVKLDSNNQIQRKVIVERIPALYKAHQKGNKKREAEGYGLIECFSQSNLYKKLKATDSRFRETSVLDLYYKYHQKQE